MFKFMFERHHLGVFVILLPPPPPLEAPLKCYHFTALWDREVGRESHHSHSSYCTACTTGKKMREKGEMKNPGKESDEK
jgi:hypothetical protein